MTDSALTYALIPARGGSKSIKRKNLINIIDKPLIAWSILQAKKSKNISRVIVSTDDKEIAEIAKEYGAEVPFMRPKEFSSDTSTDYDVFNHFIHWLKRNENILPDYIVHLRPTGPARYIDLIEKAVKEISSQKEYDSLRSVSLSDQTPYKMWFINDQKLISIGEIIGEPNSHSQPRQLLKKAYWQNGYVDIIKTDTIMNLKSITGPVILPFVINHNVRDIDYMDDIPLVEDDLRKVIKDDFKEPYQDTEERHPT